MWHDAVLVAGKDLRIEARSRVGLWQIVPFALLVLILLALAIGPDQAALRHAAPGIFWVALLFSTVLAIQRSVAVESGEGTRDGLRLSGIDPGGIFLGKAAAVGLHGGGLGGNGGRDRSERGAAAPLLFARDAPAGHGHDAIGERDGERGFVRRHEHGRAVAHGLADEAAQEVARTCIEAGVRLVEEPQGRAPCDQRGQRDPPALARRQTACRRGAQAADQA